ncbi:MaoC/PaaZ C-terminal domain-containing protein [Streptomyces sp. NBC_00485]|uniref:3-hydroxyacyl-ACP dehydratase FabZ family protein n=1 Tax=Streptomyces sp. NBC_00485 TaxID=2975758 RepID=UPI002E18362A
MRSIALMPEASVVRTDATGIEMSFAVDPTAPVFTGHYPDFPLLPGVFTLDAVHQAVLRHAEDDLRPTDLPTGLPTDLQLVDIRSVRFQSPVLPGDTLTVEAAVKDVDGTRDVRATCRTERGRTATLRLRYGTPGQRRPTAAAPSDNSPLPKARYGPAALKKLIPHRYPALLVDGVHTVDPGRRIITTKAVTCNEPWYQDVPDSAGDTAYAYPTALLIESWCQSAALLAAWDRPPDELAGQVALFGGMSGIGLGAEVLPGDVLRHEVRISRALEGTWIFEGTTTVDGSAVLTVDSVMTALRPSEALTGLTAAAQA